MQPPLGECDEMQSSRADDMYTHTHTHTPYTHTEFNTQSTFS